MPTIKYHREFKRDYKRVQKRGYNLALLEEVIRMLAKERPLATKYCDHALSGDYSGCRECHIAPDWLLVYEICNEELVLYLTRTGAHGDLF